jgi:hypothetical protein
VKEILIISIPKLVVHPEGRKWKKRTSMMNRRGTGEKISHGLLSHVRNG